MKLMFWGMFAAGFAACTAFGIGPVLKRMGGQWTSAPMLIGIALGVAILALAVMWVTGTRPALLASDSAMVVALAALIGAKVLVGLLAMSPILGKA